MNVIFTPAMANGYSHTDRAPSCFRRRSWKDFCMKRLCQLWMKDNLGEAAETKIFIYIITELLYHYVFLRTVST